MTKKRKIDEMITPLGGPLKQLVHQQTARPTRVGNARDAERALLIADVAHSLPARMWTNNPKKDWYVTAPPEFPHPTFTSRLGHSSSSSPQPFSSSCDRSAKERRADGPWSVICLAKKRQPYISTRLLPALAILMDKKISPGFVELASRKPNHHYGIRAAKSLEDAQARFVPNDFLPGSSYTQGMQGAYATGTAVSTEVVREAVDLMDKKCAEVARTDAQTSDRRFTTAVIAFVEGPGKGENFILIPYTGLGITGKSSIHSRFLYKFSDQQLISRFWRTCAFIASEKVGGIKAHMRIFNVVMITLPILNELFLHAGNAYGTILEFQHDIEALIGGAFVGGRLADGGLNVAELGSGTLDTGFDLSRGFGAHAYAVMETIAVRSRVPRKQVEGRAAYQVFEKYTAVCQKIVELHGLLKEKTTTVGVLARADAKTRGDRIPTMKQLTAGEFARWLNAAGGRGHAAERERLEAVSLILTWWAIRLTWCFVTDTRRRADDLGQGQEGQDVVGLSRG